MTTERPLRVAVIGADRDGRGFGARAHLPAVLAAPGVELAAVCTTRQETADLAAERYGAERAYAGIESLVGDPEIDLITIAVRVRSHYPLAWTALKAGKMVYCEWPLGLNALEARTLARLAQQTGVLTAVGTQGRFAPGILYLQELLAQGFIGRPLFFHMTHLLPRFPVRSDHWLSAMEEEHSGALGVAASHATDTLQAILGPVVELSGYAETLRPQDRYADTGEAFAWTTMDTISYQARLQSGVSGTVHVSNLTTYQMGFRLDIFGEEGQLTASAPYYVSYSPVRLQAARTGAQEPEELSIPAEFYHVAGLEEASPGYNISQALVALRRSWLSVEDFGPSFSDAYRLHRLVETVKRSWESRRWLAVPDDDGVV
ncbi:MAG: Gfo/Idh/MocA family oxidoreductase [Trueperaceae bacterium]|nr:MAG: Gfo/Idh/MocA family oxidoreductase [Trueperaceae bacterium]